MTPVPVNTWTAQAARRFAAVTAMAVTEPAAAAAGT